MSLHLHSDDEDEEPSKKSLSDQLECLVRCFICYQRVRNPHECPKCSQMACLHCYKEWIYRNGRCPTCREELVTSQLKKCRRVEQLLEQIEIDWKNIHTNKEGNDLKREEKEKSSPEKGKNERCMEHKMKMIYFCKECNKSLCSDCMLFSPEDHMAHRDQIKKIDEILDIKLEELNGEIKRVEEQSKNIRKMRSTMQEHKENLQKYKAIQIHKLREFYKTTRASIEEKYKELQQELDEHKIYVRNEEEALSTLRAEMVTVQKQVKRKAKRESKYYKLYGSKVPMDLVEESLTKLKKAVSHRQDKEKFEEIQAQIDYQIETIKHQRLMGNEIEPPYVTYAYTLPNYEDIRKQKEIIYSPEFRLRTLKWRLKIYPNGTDANLDRFLSVFLELQSGLPDDQEEGKVFQYRISMKHPQKSEEDINREFASTFKNEECWGYNRFHAIFQILQDGYLDEEGSLHFEFSLRHPNYEQTVTDMQQYIDELEELVALHQMDEPSSKLYEKIFSTSSSSIPDHSENHSIPMNVSDIEKDDESEIDDVDEEDDDKVSTTTTILTTTTSRQQITPLLQTPQTDVDISGGEDTHGELHEEVEGEGDEDKESTCLDILDNLMHRNKCKDMDIGNAFEFFDAQLNVPHHSVSLVDSDASNDASTFNSSMEFNRVVNNAQKIIFGNNLDLHTSDQEEEEEEDTDEESETEASTSAPFIFHAVEGSFLKNEPIDE